MVFLNSYKKNYYFCNNILNKDMSEDKKTLLNYKRSPETKRKMKAIGEKMDKVYDNQKYTASVVLDFCVEHTYKALVEK